MPETKEEYRTKAALVKCRPVGEELVCRIKEIHGNDLKESEFRVKKVSIDGCGGADAIVEPGELRLQSSSWMSEKDIEESFREDPRFFAEYEALDVIIDKKNMKLIAFNVRPYPCE
jgi:hypothetical protein